MLHLEGILPLSRDFTTETMIFFLNTEKIQKLLMFTGTGLKNGSIPRKTGMSTVICLGKNALILLNFQKALNLRWLIMDIDDEVVEEKMWA